MPNKSLSGQAVDAFDHGFVTYLRLFTWKGDWRYQSYRHEGVDIWSHPFALGGGCTSPAIQLEITRKKPAAPVGFILIGYWWIQKKDGADPVTMYSDEGVDKADGRDILSSVVYRRLGPCHKLYKSIIENALKQHPEVIEAINPESNLSVSSVRKSQTIGSMQSRGQKRARDRVQDPDTIKRLCLRDRLDYIEMRRSCEGNVTWGIRSSDTNSGFGEGFVDSIMTGYDGGTVPSTPMTSSSLSQYRFAGDHSQVEQ